MKKMFTKRLLGYMIVALLATIGFIFGLQTFVAQSTNTDSAKEKLAKARAFAEILASDKTVLTNEKRLQEICDSLMVNELHVIDEKGIITHSTISAYIGFDMNSGEQSAAFMVIVDDPSIVIVQEPQKNAAEGTVIQYIGVARTDAKGLVQVGIRPEILEETLANTEIDVVLRDIDYGDNGYVFATDVESGEVLAHPNAEIIGKYAVYF